jgi:predicted Zn-dependent protease with MMP-like domain
VILIGIEISRDMKVDWSRLESLAGKEVDTVIEGLADPLRKRAQGLSITFERYPNRAQLRDGIQRDTLGLFIGPEFAEEPVSSFPLPPQIVLFLGNLWELAQGEEKVFCEEVQTTFLHELGHYLGLDEDDLIDRGLE